jgi:tetratricopeptide (TPR) repeat protein
MANAKLVLVAVAALGLAAVAATLWWPTSVPNAEVVADENLPVPPVPPRIAEGGDYDKCLSMLNADPSGALAFAETWASSGGGDGALHCRALAQVALGNPEEGAALLDQVAGSSKASPAARAAVLGQAVQSWMMAGEPQKAYDAATKALALMPDEPDLLVDRAIASSNLDKYQEAADDLTRALDADPRRGDALVLRAVAWRHLGKLNRARDDIGRALALDPDDPDALLERGILRQRRGDQAGARKDWERAMALAPDTSTADLAQQNLALLEAGPEQR